MATTIKIESPVEKQKVFTYLEAKSYAIGSRPSLFRTARDRQLVYFDTNGQVMQICTNWICVGTDGWEKEEYVLANDEVTIHIKN